MTLTSPLPGCSAALPAMTRDMQEEIWAENCRRIGEAFAAALPPLDAPEGKEMVLGKGSLSVTQVDLSNLGTIRHQHQTRHAAEAVRTRSSPQVPPSDSPDTTSNATAHAKSIRRKLIQEFYVSVRKIDERGVGTGKNRQLRWFETGSGEASSEAAGNSANAATVAASAANAVSPSLRMYLVVYPADTCLL